MLNIRDLGCFDLTAMTDSELRKLADELEYRLWSITAQLDEAAKRVNEKQLRTLRHEFVRRSKEGLLARREVACHFLEEAQRMLPTETYRAILEAAKRRGNAVSESALQSLTEAARG